MRRKKNRILFSAELSRFKKMILQTYDHDTKHRKNLESDEAQAHHFKAPCFSAVPKGRSTRNADGYKTYFEPTSVTRTSETILAPALLTFREILYIRDE